MVREIVEGIRGGTLAYVAACQRKKQWLLPLLWEI